MNKKILLLIFIFLQPILSFAQNENLALTAVEKYIAQFKDLAISEQIRSGVPAAVTLAQGIHESAAGTSILAYEANNHFGIKCKNTWTGETILHDDDAVQECFRKYKTAQDSYKDHSDFLKNNRRYAFLFDIPVTNYQEWAVGLRKAGYATNPRYSSRISELIQKHDLQKYTIEAQRSQISIVDSLEEATTKAENASKEAAIKAKEEKKLLAQKKKEEKERIEAEALEIKANRVDKIDEEATKLNGLNGFYAKKGTALLKEAILHDVRYSKLLEWNDLPDEPLREDMFIYLERKYKKCEYKRVHVVAPGETLHAISQMESIQLKSLMQLNQLEEGEMPIVGTKLFLQTETERKPKLVKNTQITEPEIKVVVSTPQPEKPKIVDVDIASDLFSNKKKEVVVPVVEPEIIKEEKVAAPEKVQERINTIDSKKIVVDKDAIKAAQQDLAMDISEGATEIEKPSQSEEIAEIKTEIKNVTQPVAVNSPVVTTKIESVKTEVVNIPVVIPKSPSNYNEPNTSAEIRKLKKVMDEIVYMAPLPKKVVPVKQDSVSKPVTKPSSAIIKTGTPTTPKTTTVATNKVKTDTIKPSIKKDLPKVATKSNTKNTTDNSAKPVVNSKPVVAKKDTVKNVVAKQPVIKKEVDKKTTDKSKTGVDKKTADKAVADKKVTDKKSTDKKEATKKETDKKATVKKAADKTTKSKTTKPTEKK